MKNKTMKNKIMIIAACAMLIAGIGSTASAQAKKGKFKQTTGAKSQKVSKAQTVRVELGENGYQPRSFKLKKGVPARVTFVRRIEETCGKEISLPEYNIRRELPLNKPVTVEFTPTKAGEFNFTCGMGMLRGTVVVQ